jgi:hypothetical protein
MIEMKLPDETQRKRMCDLFYSEYIAQNSVQQHSASVAAATATWRGRAWHQCCKLSPFRKQQVRLRSSEVQTDEHYESMRLNKHIAVAHDGIGVPDVVQPYTNLPFKNSIDVHLLALVTDGKCVVQHIMHAIFQCVPDNAMHSF